MPIDQPSHTMCCAVSSMIGRLGVSRGSDALIKGGMPRLNGRRSSYHAGALPRNQNKTIGVTSLCQDRFPASGDFVLNCNLHGIQFRGLSPRTDQENMADFRAAFGPSLLPPLAVDRVSIGVPR
jgi:hypothetical protein